MQLYLELTKIHKSVENIINQIENYKRKTICIINNLILIIKKKKQKKKYFIT
jgi:hypothetical protein